MSTLLPSHQRQEKKRAAVFFLCKKTSTRAPALAPLVHAQACSKTEGFSPKACASLQKSKIFVKAQDKKRFFKKKNYVFLVLTKIEDYKKKTTFFFKVPLLLKKP